MYKYILALGCSSFIVSTLAQSCALGPEGINLWRLVYQVGSCVQSGNDKLDGCCSSIEATLTAIDFGALTKLDPLISQLEACDICSHFDLIESQLTKIDSKLDTISVSLFDQIYSVTNLIESVVEKIYGTVTIIDSFTDVIISKIDELNSALEVCSTISTLISRVDECCSVLDTDIRSVSDVLGSKSEACCVTLSTLDRLILSDVDSVSTKVDSVSSKIDVLGSKADVCCSLLDRDLKSISDVLGSKIDYGTTSALNECCSTLSVLEVINKTSIDSVGSQVSQLGSRSDACCVSLSTLDRLILSDVDSVSTKVDSVSSKIDALDSKSEACCALLSTFDRLILSDIDSVSSKIDMISACDQTAVLSELDVLTSKVMTLESVLEAFLDVPQAFVSCFGDGVTAGREEYIAIDYQYGLDLYDNVSTLDNLGSILTTNSMVTLQTGTNAAGGSSLQTRRQLRYRPGHQGYCFFTAGFLNGGAANSTQWIGLFDTTDGMAVGYSGTSFAVLYRSFSVDTITTQANFNVDKLDGTGPSGIIIDPTKINIFRLAYGWLGVATLEYQIFRTDCTWHTFHEVLYANTNTRPHISNPVLPMRAQVVNTGNTNNLQLATASWNAGILGDFSHVAQRVFSVSNGGKNVATTEIPLVSIRDNTTYQGVLNHIEARLYAFGGGDFGSANARIILRLRKNATLTGAAFANVDATNSIMSVDTSATAVSGGQLMLISPSMNGSGGPQINYLSDMDVDVYMIPGDVLTITAQADTGAGGTNVQGIFTWAELF